MCVCSRAGVGFWNFWRAMVCFKVGLPRALEYGQQERRSVDTH